METRYVDRIKREGTEWIVVRLIRGNPTEGYRWMELYRGESQSKAEAWLDNETKKGAKA